MSAEAQGLVASMLARQAAEDQAMREAGIDLSRFQKPHPFQQENPDE